MEELADVGELGGGAVVIVGQAGVEDGHGGDGAGAGNPEDPENAGPDELNPNERSKLFV